VQAKIFTTEKHEIAKNKTILRLLRLLWAVCSLRFHCFQRVKAVFFWLKSTVSTMQKLCFVKHKAVLYKNKAMLYTCKKLHISY